LNLPTALIADDNAEWRSVIAEVLRADYDVVCIVARGDEVMAKASVLRPDLVTLDVSMPGISGIQLLPRLRTLLPNARILIVTANSAELYVQEAYRRGADGYVLKSNVWRDLPPPAKQVTAPPFVAGTKRRPT